MSPPDPALTAYPEYNTAETNISHVENYLASRRRKDQEQPLESKDEIKVDKTELKTHLSSLIGSTSVAIGRLQTQLAKNPGSHGAAEKIAEYQMVQANAQVILSELNEPGAGHNLLAFSEALEALQADSTYEADKPDDGSDSDAKKDQMRFMHMSPREQDIIVAEQPLMRRLRRHTQAMEDMSADSAMLSTQAPAGVDDGFRDLLAVVAVSAALYELQSGNDKAVQHLNDIIAQRGGEIAQQAKSAGATDEEAQAIVDTRLADIKDKAQYIHQGTLTSDAEGEKRILEAFDDLVRKPLKTHVQQSDAHFRQAVAELGNASPHMQKLAMQMHTWDSQKHHIENLGMSSAIAGHAAISHASGVELYKSLMKDVDMDGLIGESRHVAQASQNLHLAHSNVYHHASQSSQHLEHKVASVLKGDSHDIKGVAHQLGMGEKYLRINCLKCRVDLDQPIGALGHAFTKDRIDFQTGRGHGLANGLQA